MTHDVQDPSAPACPEDPLSGDRLSQLQSEVEALRRESLIFKAQLELRDRALDATPTRFVVADHRGPEPIIVYCNKSVAQQHGFRREELIGQSIKHIAQWDRGDPSIPARIRETLAAGQTFRYEHEVARPDGSCFWVGVAVMPIMDGSGTVTHHVSVGADITARREEARKKQDLQERLVTEMKERERLVIELQLAQKLESVGRLASGIAHEINTPVQYVGDSVHFLHSAFDDMNRFADDARQTLDALPDSPAIAHLRAALAELSRAQDLDFLRIEVPKAFERTFDGVERVTRIVKAMKEFAHPDAAEHSPADLNHALATTLLVASNEYKHLAKVRAEYGDLPAVTCNVGELNQVFLNLIVNAAHAIQDAARDVGTGEIKITTAVLEDAAIVRIGDNGCGIATENSGKVYDPFFTTKEVGRGTGQGLAIARSIIVDKHGGELTFKSELGVGTEFTLRIPLTGRRHATVESDTGAVRALE
jgi:PAS domain S-box-containing protein